MAELSFLFGATIGHIVLLTIATWCYGGDRASGRTVLTANAATLLFVLLLSAAGAAKAEQYFLQMIAGAIVLGLDAWRVYKNSKSH